MKNPPFVYHRPDTVEEVVALLAEHGDDAKILAGGQSLLPIMALRLGRPEHLIDIGRVAGLADITVDGEGAVHVGALVRHRDAERSAVLAERAPLVHQAVPYIGHRAIRTRGTVCGSIAHADPAAEMPAVALALNATMLARSAAGTREIAATDFFHGYLQTALRSDELLTAVRFPAWPAGAHGAVVEVSRRHGDYALVGCVCRLQVEGDTIAEAALAFFGVAGTPVRVRDAEAALVGRRTEECTATGAGDDGIAGVVTCVTDALDPPADLHGTANYRRHLAGVLTRRAIAAALTATPAASMGARP